MRATHFLLVGLAACFSPSPREGLPCSESGACPDGQTCDPVDNLCKSGELTSADARDTAGDARADASGALVDAAGGPTCAGTCVDVPNGWSGPVVLYAGTGPRPACPAGFPSLVHDLDGDLQAAQADCGCACGAPSGLSCGPVTLREKAFAQFQCFELIEPKTWTIGPGACRAMSTTTKVFSSSTPTLNTQGASCAPQPSTTVPPAGWQTNVRACRGDLAACPGGLCVPALDPSFDQLCIWAQGPAACPGAVFTERHVYHSGFDDQRGCSACTCSTPSGTCGGQVDLSTGGCASPDRILVGTVSVGSSCDGGTDVPTEGSYQSTITASCDPVGGDPMGDATETGPVTFCCRP